MTNTNAPDPTTTTPTAADIAHRAVLAGYAHYDAQGRLCWEPIIPIASHNHVPAHSWGTLQSSGHALGSDPATRAQVSYQIRLALERRRDAQ